MILPLYVRDTNNEKEGVKIMTLTLCKDTQCQQAKKCARFDDQPEANRNKVHFIKSPRGPLGCLEYKRIKRRNDDK